MGRFGPDLPEYNVTPKSKTPERKPESKMSSSYSYFIIFHNATQIKQTKKVYGKPAAIDAACNAFIPALGSATSKSDEYVKPVAERPSVKDQKTRCAIHGSRMPLAATIVSTNDPESDEVMKYRNKAITINTDKNVPKETYWFTTSNIMGG